ncbi:Ubiquitin carboxyl-terminal hydrolase 25 [Amphibalanus amphitrite]|uniref:ubiquitinyl hydrolase 1 n=1 Tax=Amphibalanus amphitrite TaxID=1232801 RepID=A0A6A4W196_AMPAM|nr:Ubiquitin carboxyl-terminal hydrolase 25 [Amphibalanus amphitrite]
MSDQEMSPPAADEPCTEREPLLPPLCPSNTPKEELAVVQRCLERWSHEVDRQVRELKRQMAEITARIENMFDEPGLRQVPYRLHSVLVHEGQAGSGHYWAYVFHPRRRVWLKFNDNTVSESTWDSLCLESFGGHHNTSAYCLVYIDCNRSELMDDRLRVDKEAGMVEPADEAESLSLPLRQYVDEDNRQFQEAIDNWNSQPKGGASEDAVCAGGAGGDQPMAEEPEDCASTATSWQWEDLSARHAAISLPQTLDLLKATVAAALPDTSVKEVLKEAALRSRQSVYDLSEEMSSDPGGIDHRMSNMAVYLARNGAEQRDLNWLLLEQFAHRAVSAVPVLRDVYKTASLELGKLVERCSAEERRQYRCWHVHYNEFRFIAWSTVLGLGELAKEKYTEALMYLLQACERNEQLVTEQQPDRGLDPQLLANFRRRAIMGLNKRAVDTFLSGQLEQAVELTQEATVPALLQLARSGLAADRDAAEDVRNKWCSLLGQPLDDSSQRVLQEIITHLIEPASEHERAPLPIKIQLSVKRCGCPQRPADSDTILLVLPGGAELKPRAGESLPPLVRRPPRPATPGAQPAGRLSRPRAAGRRGPELPELTSGSELRLELAKPGAERLTAAGFGRPAAISEDAALPDGDNNNEENLGWRVEEERPRRPSPELAAGPLSPPSPGHLTVSDGSDSDPDNWGEPLLSDDERSSPEPEQPVWEGPFRRPMLRPPADMGSYSPCAYRAPLTDRPAAAAPGVPAAPAAAATEAPGAAAAAPAPAPPAGRGESYRPPSPPDEEDRGVREAASVLVAMSGRGTPTARPGSPAEDRPRLRHNAEPGLLTLQQPGGPPPAAGTREKSNPGSAASGTCPKLRELLSRPPTVTRADTPDPAAAARARRLEEERMKRRARKQELVDRYNAELWADCSIEETAAGKRQREENLSPAPRPLQQARRAPVSPAAAIGGTEMTGGGTKGAEVAAGGPENAKGSAGGPDGAKMTTGGKKQLACEAMREHPDVINNSQKASVIKKTPNGRHSSADSEGANLSAAANGNGHWGGAGGEYGGGSGQVTTELDLLTLSDSRQLSGGGSSQS